MQQRFCANLMNKTDADRPDQRRFFVKIHFPSTYSIRRIPGNFSVSLRLEQGSIRCGIILENLSYFSSEPACTQFGSLMLTVLFCRVQNHLPHTLQTQASTSRETGISGNIFLTAEMSFPDGNKPALSSSCSAMKNRSRPYGRLQLKAQWEKIFPHFYKAVGISLPSSDAFLAEPSPAIRSRITSL